MASSVRAKAAMFANLGNNGSGNSASNLGGGQSVYNKYAYPSGSSSSSSATILGNSAIVNTSSSSAIQLPPTSSASTSDPSISHPINAPFYPKVSAGSSNTPTRKPVGTMTKQEEPPSPYTAARLRANSANAKNQASKSVPSQGGPSEQPSLLSSRRKQVDRLDVTDQKPTKADAGKLSTTNGDTTASASPPLLPIKPYPPKLSAGAPQTPFALNFPSSAKSETPSAIEKDYSHGTFARQQSRIPRLSQNRSLGERSLGASSKKMEDGQDSTLTKDLSRESVYSTTSSLGVSANVVVATANAVSIQRMANPARTIASNATAAQSRPTKAAQGPSVDKGIGVKTRRKSRESTSSEKRRPRSNRNSSAPSEKAANVSMTSNSDQGQNDKKIGVSSVNNDDSKSNEKPTKRSLTATPRFPTAMQEGLGANHKSHNEERSGSTSTKNNMDRLTPLDIPRANRTISGQSNQSISSVSSAISDSNLDGMSGKYSLSPSGISATSLLANESLDPLSETWGRNSNLSGQSTDLEERLLSITGMRFPHDETKSVTTTEKDFKLTIDAPSENGGAERGKLGATKTLEMKKILSKMGDRVASARSGSSPGISTYDLANGIPLQRATQSTSPLTPNSQTGSAFKMATPITKDALLMELLASMSLVDAQSFKALGSLEDVEILKRNLTRVERDIGDVQLKLKVHIRVRDAANKVRKASARPRNGSGSHAHSASISSAVNTPITPSFSSTTMKDSFGNHSRRISSSSTSAGVTPSDVQQSEADAAAATKKVDHISRKLLELHAEAAKLRRQLLEHHAKILATRIETLESSLQQHDQLRQQEDDKEEESKVGALLAADELDRLRDKHARVEQALKHEQEDRQKEIERWRKKYDEDTQLLKNQHKTLQDDHSRNIKQLQDQHSKHSTTANKTQQSLEERIHSQDKELEERQKKYEELQRQMEQLDFETTAERNIMNQRQQLFSAFEQRLERAEKRLREQDDRCARMLGKAEGREEMDDLLNQIKYGTSGAPKKEKTAGQDIDGLIDSLTTHINDMEDELERATMNGLRGDAGESDGEGQQRSAPRGMSSYDSDYADTIEKLNGELHGAQREAEEWRIQAESAKRRLANIQRQSAISMTSTTNGRLSVTGWNAGQSSYGSGFAGRRPSNGTSTLMRLSGPSRSAAELEARITLLERRNAALEAELSHAREEGTSIDTTPESLGKENSSFTKVAGNADSAYNSMKLRSPKSSSGSTDLFTKTVGTLLELLPALDQGTTDLHEIQEELESMPRNEGIDTKPSNAKEICRIVVDRTRAALSVSRSLVGKLLALEMEKRDMEEELEAVHGEHEEMKVAMEDMRNGHASQMQIIEASKTREQQLQTALSGLEVELEETRKQMRQQLASAQTSLTPTSATMQTSPSLASMINSQASHIVPLQQRRNIMPVHKGSTMLVAPSNASSNGQSPSSMRGTTALPVNPPLVSPSSSKFSLSSTLQTTSTPAPSHPAWSPSVAGNGTAMNLSEITPSKPSSIPKRTRTDTMASGATPRTMMLGMGTSEMMERIRSLEADLAYAKIHSNRSKAEEVERGEMDERLIALQNELESNRMEMEEIRNVESRQRIDLMEELTNLTTELSDARAQLRQRNDPIRRR
ncbi:uncharacterized protein FA14DRAFT_188861 [Meira miltonrushii]|uniref:Up-regulated during septation protein 1 domain-containing protein n=1 Tax=Meira miltonrushii TaxID=1280837 RepID=A0A316VBY6_9BASI|nr:uncharacterized protein FA14DRAFT_188861 [Meira miltonrushii]PWN34814.1 hypothetical protein FA14DRAFT_188861 [Meira miltonrushii]